MAINQLNNVLQEFSLPDWSEMSGVVDALTIIFISAHPVIFDI